MTLFLRTWAVTVGTLRVTPPMRVAFDLERTLRPQPNKGTVRIHNLTRAHQAEIEQAEEAQVIVEAGYERLRGLETIFRGEIFRARGANPPSLSTSLSMVDAVTSIEARDGGRAYQRARVSQGFEPGVSLATVIRALTDAMGIGEGNARDAVALAELEAGGATFPEGTVVTGQASRELTRLLGSMGLTWSVQHGALQVIRRGEVLQTDAVLISPSTGLVGFPEVGARGRVTVQAKLIPDLWPGRRIDLESRRVTGSYRARSVRYAGDSHANEWGARLELEPVGVAA